MTSSGSRRAGLAAALVLAAACTPREGYEPRADAAATDADFDSDGGFEDDADFGEDGGADAPRCTPGGTTALEPVTIACGQPAPARIGVDDSNVYWVVQRKGAIVMKAPLAGGSSEALVHDDVAAVGLAVGVRFVFYTQPGAGRVMRVPKVGGLPVAIATKLDTPLFLAIDLDAEIPALYWTGGSGENGVIMRLALLEGATPTVLLDGQPRPRAIAVRDGFVYWTDFSDGSLRRLSVDAAQTDAGAPDAGGPDGGEPDGGVRVATRLASGLRGPSDLALADGFAYLPDQSGRIARVPMEGGALETFAAASGVPFGVATNGLALYWTTLGTEGRIFRRRLAGDSPVTTLVAGELDPHFLAVGRDAVFWGAWGLGAVRKIAR
jgi:hypothetical protein